MTAGFQGVGKGIVLLGGCGAIAVFVYSLGFNIVGGFVMASVRQFQLCGCLEEDKNSLSKSRNNWLISMIPIVGPFIALAKDN